jgi:hypothetical protein
MTSQSKSKAQRRAEAQRRAAEQRATELRKKRARVGLRLGGLVVVIAAVVLIVVLVSGGSTSVPPQLKNPHLADVQAVPASMSSSWVQPPATTPGPETVPVPSGPKLATLLTAATGQSVDGVQCQTNEQTLVHVHTHLTIFVNGQARVIPYGIGIPGVQAINLDEWGIPLSSTQVGPATGKVTVFFTSPGKKAAIYTGNPRNLPLGDHYQIQLDVGTPIVAPVHVTNWGGL